MIGKALGLYGNIRKVQLAYLSLHRNTHKKFTSLSSRSEYADLPQSMYRKMEKRQ